MHYEDSVSATKRIRAMKHDDILRQRNALIACGNSCCSALGVELLGYLNPYSKCQRCGFELVSLKNAKVVQEWEQKRWETYLRKFSVV